MKSFSIKIAETVVKITPMFSQVFEMCRDYLTEEDPLFEIETTENDLEKERAMAGYGFCVVELFGKLFSRILIFKVLYSKILP